MSRPVAAASVDVPASNMTIAHRAGSCGAATYPAAASDAAHGSLSNGGSAVHLAGRANPGPYRGSPRTPRSAGIRTLFPRILAKLRVGRIRHIHLLLPAYNHLRKQSWSETSGRSLI